MRHPKRFHHKHKHHRKNHKHKVLLQQLTSKNLTFKEKVEAIWEKLGPGIVTGASDDDPSGITTYSQAGASFGLMTLWTAFLSFPLMAAIQEMCGRIGLVTNMGLTSVVKKHYPKWVIYLIGVVSIPAMVLNISANLAGMGAVANMIFPFLPSWLFMLISAVAVIFTIILLSYKRLENILKWLCFVLFVYLIVPFLIKVDWFEVLQYSLIPHFEFSKEYIGIIVAILGTTISPYLFFWETSMEVEEHQNQHKKSGTEVVLESDSNNLEATGQFQNVNIDEIKSMTQDNNIGMLFSNVTMFFVILTTGLVLYKNGINEINSVQDAASALKPLAGDMAYILFAIGIIGTGFLSIPVLAGSCGYIISEIFDWSEGMNKKFSKARGFYEVIAFSILIGLALNLSGIDPIKSLIWTAIAYGLTAPILIAIILNIANKESIMGKWKNGKISNFLGYSTLTLMTLAIIALIYVSFF